MNTSPFERWDAWSQHYADVGVVDGRLVRDGVALPDVYAQEKTKVLFVLRDPNNSPGTDMRALLRKGPEHQIWHTLARWAAGTLSGFAPYKDVSRSERKVEALRRVAVINLKKESGGARTDLAILNAIAHRDQHVLREQVELLAPRLVIACGTFDQLVWLLDLDPDPAALYRAPAWNRKRTLQAVNFRHPAQSHGEKDYERLKGLVMPVLASL